jgi:Bifunctional DNA primase/polymerase, N-terminal
MMDDRHLTGHPVPAQGGAAEQGGCGQMSRLATPEEMLAAALAYAAAGWPVFPCEIGGKRPAVPRGFKAATTSRIQILNWWEGQYAGCNIGGLTGAPGPDILDVDVRADGSGWAAFNRLKRAGLLAGAFRLVRTPSGGLHVYFAGTAQRCGSLKAHHLDLKACGGYVLVPPSQVDGRPYQVTDERPPTGATFDWEAAKRMLAPPGPVRVWTGRGGSVAHLRDWVAGQGPGNRNHGLYWAAMRAAEARDQDTLLRLADAAVSAGLDEAEAHRTITSAIRRVNGGR